jgi:hypothetical protein
MAEQKHDQRFVAATPLSSTAAIRRQFLGE